MAIAVGLLVIALVVFAEGIHALVVAPPDEQFAVAVTRAVNGALFIVVVLEVHRGGARTGPDHHRPAGGRRAGLRDAARMGELPAQYRGRVAAPGDGRLAHRGDLRRLPAGSLRRRSCRSGEESQHPTCPQVRQSRRWTHSGPRRRHSSQPSGVRGVTGRTMDRCGSNVVCLSASCTDAGSLLAGHQRASRPSSSCSTGGLGTSRRYCDRCSPPWRRLSRACSARCARVTSSSPAGSPGIDRATSCRFRYTSGGMARSALITSPGAPAASAARISSSLPAG